LTDRWTRLASLAALVLGAAAIVAWRSAERRSGRGTAGPGLAELEERVTALERAVQEALREPRARAPEARAPLPAPDGDPATAERLEALEEALRRTEEEVAVWLAGAGASSKEVSSLRIDDRALVGTRLGEESVLAAQQAFLDGRLDLRDRLAALRSLQRFPAEMRALEPVLPTAIELLRGTEDVADLELVVDSVDGIADERLCTPLLDLLADHRNEEGLVLELLSALDDSLDRPDVRQAFEDVASSVSGQAKRRASGLLDAYRQGRLRRGDR